MRKILFSGLSALLLLGAAPAGAWGPHSEITQAVLDNLGTNHALVRHLGPHAQRLTNYCWMGDYHRVLFQDPDQVFYADDYLRFPGANPQWEHTGPWLKLTVPLFFQRALQALRTESPANASRWLGSLTHFVQDAGAPPHALGLKGALHSRMENWLDIAAIHIPDYQPQSLGATEEQALAALEKRMQALDEFARSRAKKLRLQVELGNRIAVRPVVLECALETARVTADVLHTLSRLGLESRSAGGVLVGRIQSSAAPAMDLFPAKVLLEGTAYSTLCDAQGAFEFCQMPPGGYNLIAIRPGNAPARQAVVVAANQTNQYALVLKRDAGNLLRNPDFQIKWSSTQIPEAWYSGRQGWESEFVPLQEGQRYRITARFRPDEKATLTVRFTKRPQRLLPAFMSLPRFQDETLTPDQRELTFVGTPERGVVQLVLKTTKPPGDACDGITFVPIAAK